MRRPAVGTAQDERPPACRASASKASLSWCSSRRPPSSRGIEIASKQSCDSLRSWAAPGHLVMLTSVCAGFTSRQSLPRVALVTLPSLCPDQRAPTPVGCWHPVDVAFRST